MTHHTSEKWARFLMLSIFAIALCVTSTFGYDYHEEQVEEKTLLLISSNRTDQAGIDYELQGFEKLLTSELASPHFRIITRDIVMQKMQVLYHRYVTDRTDGQDLARFVQTKARKSITENTTEGQSEQGDNEKTVIADATNRVSSYTEAAKWEVYNPSSGVFSDITSANRRTALQVAQTLDVDYILQATLIRFDRRYQPPAEGMKNAIIRYRLTTSYELINTENGATIAADTTKHSINRFSDGRNVQYDVIHESEQKDGNKRTTVEHQTYHRKSRDQSKFELGTLLEKSAFNLSALLAERLDAGLLKSDQSEGIIRVPFGVIAQTSDLGNIITFQSENAHTGETTDKLGTQIPLQTIMNVNVEIDDLTLGSSGDTPGQPSIFMVPPGRHLLRVTRQGYVPYEREILISPPTSTTSQPDPQIISVSLSFTNETLEGFYEMAKKTQEIRQMEQRSDVQKAIAKAAINYIQEHGIHLKGPEADTVTDYIEKTTDAIMGIGTPPQTMAEEKSVSERNTFMNSDGSNEITVTVKTGSDQSQKETDPAISERDKGVEEPSPQTDEESTAE